MIIKSTHPHPTLLNIISPLPPPKKKTQNNSQLEIPKKRKISPNRNASSSSLYIQVTVERWVPVVSVATVKMQGLSSSPAGVCWGFRRKWPMVTFSQLHCFFFFGGGDVGKLHWGFPFFQPWGAQTSVVF